jgi:hypothetical protein
MSQPPIDPTGRDSSADASPTEPVPAFEPAPTPQDAAGIVSPLAPPELRPAGSAGTDLEFVPVQPEPEPGQDPAVPRVTASPGGRLGSGSSKPILVAMGAIVLVGVAAVAFAAGRTSVPASDTTGGVSNRQELQGGGRQGGRQGQDGSINGQDQGRGGAGRSDSGQDGKGNGSGNGQGQGRGGGRMDQGGLGPMGGGMLPNAQDDPNGNGLRPGDGSGGDVGSTLPGWGLGRAGLDARALTGTVTAVTPDSVTFQTEGGMRVTVGLDAGTTYHQQAPAASSDVTTGSQIEVQLDGGVRPSQDASGNINLGTAGDVTVLP